MDHHPARGHPDQACPERSSGADRRAGAGGSRPRPQGRRTLRSGTRHRMGHRSRRHVVAAAGSADDRRARHGVLDCARPGVVDAELPARRVAARGRHATVRHMAAAGAGGWLPRRHARHRRSPGAVSICAGQRLVLQHPSDPVTKTVGASAVARTRSRGEGLVQRADPSQPQPCRRRPGSAVGSGPAVARGSTARVPAAGRSTPKPRPRRRHRTGWRS